MQLPRNLRRRVDDALATASPLALADSMDAHISSRSSEDVRGLIERSLKRMDSGDRAQLALYVNLDDPDDLIGHRFSAFLRQNPRAIAALDREDIDSILGELGDLPAVPHPVRRLPPRTLALAIAAVALAILPLAAQYVHQRGLISGLSEPVLPPPIVPFVQAVAPRPVPARKSEHHRAPGIAHRAVHHRTIALRHARLRPHHAVALAPHVRKRNQIAWKFDRRNNPYFNPVRWRHPYVADVTPFGMRARLSVRSYLHALIAGNLSAALVHLGMPPSADTTALAELPIISRSTTVAIVGSKPQPDGSEQVQADITTSGREYFAIFGVQHDGPATRIFAHYYIPVNRSAQIAARAIRTE